MDYKGEGRIIKGTGGLYTIELSLPATDVNPLGGTTVCCRARGAFRHDNETPLAGDRVSVLYSDTSFASGDGGVAEPMADGRGIIIESICERKNSLIRPPLANLDMIIVTLAAASPMPSTEITDKLISIAEFNHIEPVVVVGKCELDREAAERIKGIYTLAGYDAFVLSCLENEGVDEFAEYLHGKLNGRIAAFAGASGVGKSTLMNAVFPGFSLETGTVSRKTERGRHTTRTVELFARDGGYIADTPGFSMLDFVRFDFFRKEDLPYTFREFSDCLGHCRYTRCTHTKEEGCAVLDKLNRGEIAPSRHESYLELYNILKEKHDWDK